MQRIFKRIKFFTLISKTRALRPLKKWPQSSEIQELAIECLDKINTQVEQDGSIGKFITPLKDLKMKATFKTRSSSINFAPLHFRNRRT